MVVSEFIFQYFFLSDFRSVFDKNMEYPTFIRIREGRYNESTQKLLSIHD